MNEQTKDVLKGLGYTAIAVLCALTIVFFGSHDKFSGWLFVVVPALTGAGGWLAGKTWKSAAGWAFIGLVAGTIFYFFI